MKAKEAKAMKHLYLIRDSESSYKIGSTKNPQSRLRELQVGSCRKLVIVWSIQTELAVWIEGYLHWKFRSQWILGEWFALNAEEVRWITSLTVEEIRRLRQEEELRHLRQKEEIHRQNEAVHDRSEDVTGMELTVLQVLWKQGTSSRRQIADSLYPLAGPAHFTTVQKLLERLEKKGHVTSSAAGTPISFTAVTDRDELIRSRLRDVADKLCGGSVMPLLRSLVRTRPPSPLVIQKLLDLLHELSNHCPARNEQR